VVPNRAVGLRGHGAKSAPLSALLIVMAVLVTAIHASLAMKQGVDGRNKSGHDSILAFAHFFG